jgi:hypothetical protein
MLKHTEPTMLYHYRKLLWPAIPRVCEFFLVRRSSLTYKMTDCWGVLRTYTAYLS